MKIFYVLLIFATFLLINTSSSCGQGFNIFEPDVDGQIDALEPKNDGFVQRKFLVISAATVGNNEREKFVKARLTVQLFRLNTKTGKFDHVKSESDSTVLDVFGSGDSTGRLGVNFSNGTKQTGTFMVKATLQVSYNSKGPWSAVDEKTNYFVATP